MPTTDVQIYTISQLNAKTKFLLEENFPLIWVEGEISNLAQPRSGHIYFSLKDEFAQVRCAMFRNQHSLLEFTPENGMHVLVQAQVSLYEQRGDYQLMIYDMEPAGDGILRQKFEQLKQKLLAEGLFAEEHKKPIPKLPQCVGVVTSPTGAAVRDIISVLKRRFSGIPIIIYPSQVQGLEAKEQITHAINIANKHNKCDILIIARGGGSLEDLWPFNEEIVARAIFNSQIPIISGVGHETDFTIADFVADMRAPTPSAAAELISPDINAWRNTIQHLQTKLAHLLTNRLRSYIQHLDHLEQRLNLGVNNLLKHKQAKLVNLSRALEAMSPLATLSRGYAIVTTKDKKVVTNATDVKVGDKINAKLKEGELICQCTSLAP